MATEKKMKDPAEAALSAIEHALNLDEAFAVGEPGEKAQVREKSQPKLPDVEEHDFTRGPFHREESPPSVVRNDRPAEPEATAPVRPTLVAPDRATVANDDRQDVGL